jgi:hypothetical protein
MNSPDFCVGTGRSNTCTWASWTCIGDDAKRKSLFGSIIERKMDIAIERQEIESAKVEEVFVG